MDISWLSPWCSSEFVALWKLYMHGNPRPTVCTIFTINPYTYPGVITNVVHPDGSVIHRYKREQSHSFVNISNLLQAAKVEKVSTVALFFITSPGGTAEFSFNIPFSVNITFMDNQGHVISAPSLIKVLMKKAKTKKIGEGVGAAAVYLYTQDGGETWQALFVKKSSVTFTFN